MALHTSISLMPLFIMSARSMSFLATSMYPSCPMQRRTAQEAAITPPEKRTRRHSSASSAGVSCTHLVWSLQLLGSQRVLQATLHTQRFGTSECQDFCRPLHWNPEHMTMSTNKINQSHGMQVTVKSPTFTPRPYL